MAVSPLLNRAGAVAGDGVDAGVAAHYGDPLREQRTFLAGSGLVDRSHRGVVTLTGPDRLSWLHSLTTQDLANLKPGVGIETLVLDPNGHIEHHLSLVDDGTTAWIHVEPTKATALVEWLTSMRFMLRVDVTDATNEVAIVTVPLAPSGSDGDLHPRIDGRLGRDVFLPRSDLEHRAAVESLVGLAAWEALRIAEIAPRLGLDTDERSIPNESRWLQTAVHLDKGCYRGQETVARVSNLGQPPRRTLLLQLDGAADRLPGRGASVELEGRSVGWVGSAARHCEMGPIALAVVKRAAADSALTAVEHVAVEVDGIGASLEADPMQVPTGRAIRPELMRFS